MVSARPLIPVILGPTAAGKSAVAMAVAERLPVEIISVDSAQVYRRLNLGTAKPTAQERALVPHHLIDIVAPDDTYSAARFARDADTAIFEVLARGKLPLLVGGTMLYFKALSEGLHDLPSADAALRLKIDLQARNEGWPAVHARLAQLDPITAARLKPTDSQRIQRALEVCLVSGQAMSTLFAQQGREPRTGGPRNDEATAPHFFPIALQPSDRAVLHTRIESRFRAMIADGLIDEVRTLRATGDLDPALPSLRSVGYRQVWAWLDALDASAVTTIRHTVNTETMIQQGLAATRQLAKRQLTWLRSMTMSTRVDCLSTNAAAQVTDLIVAATRKEK